MRRLPVMWLTPMLVPLPSSYAAVTAAAANVVDLPLLRSPVWRVRPPSYPRVHPIEAMRGNRNGSILH